MRNRSEESTGWTDKTCGEFRRGLDARRQRVAPLPGIASLLSATPSIRTVKQPVRTGRFAHRRGAISYDSAPTSQALSSPTPPYSGLALLGDPQIDGSAYTEPSTFDLRFIKRT